MDPFNEDAENRYRWYVAMRQRYGGRLILTHVPDWTPPPRLPWWRRVVEWLRRAT